MKAEVNLKRDILGAEYNSTLEKVFVFALVWSVGGAVDASSRKKLSVCMQDIDSMIPVVNTMYDFYVDVGKFEFKPWNEKVPNWRPLKSMSFFLYDCSNNSYRS